MLFASVPIVLLGIMLGFRAGLLAALYAAVVAAVWAATSGNAGAGQSVGEPLIFFLLGGLSGYFAKGVLGDFDLGPARTCSQLRRALSREQVGLYYQPIVRPNGELLAVEALARWHDPSRGIIAPLEFIPAAERDERTIWEFTRHTVRSAVRDAQELGDPVVVAVNLSPVALRRRELPDVIGEILGESNLPASRLAVEVTETEISRWDESLIVKALEGLRQLDLKMVAIDDFGIGHSSLARLARLPVDTVKIDRTLIADSARPKTGAVIEGIVHLAHSVGLTVIAEGAEDAKTWEWLIQVHCDALQGFNLSRPMPAEQLAGWLEAHKV